MAGAPMKKDEMEQLIQILITPPPAIPPASPGKNISSYTAAFNAHIASQISAAGQLGNAGAVPAVPALTSLLANPDAQLRRAAADALISIGDRSMVPSLIASLSSSDATTRETAAYVLGGLREQSAVAPLLGLLSTDTEETVRASAARALGSIGGANVLQPLSIALGHDTSSAVRYSAARGLVDIRNSNQNAAVLQPLLNGLWDPDSNVRMVVIDALGDIRNLGRAEKIQVGQMLGRVVDTDPDRFVRSDALGLLGATALQTNDRGLISSVGRALQVDPDPAIKGSAAIILSTIGGPASISALLLCLPNTDPSVRTLAAQSLGRIGDMNAMAPLRAALSRETNASVQMAMQQAIDAINRANGIVQAPPPGGRQNTPPHEEAPRQLA